VGHFLNEDLTAIVTKAEVGILQPRCVLRVADLFEVDAEGRITSQENHYDPACPRVKRYIPARLLFRPRGEGTQCTIAGFPPWARPIPERDDSY
jgi:hypothetical protein